MTEQQGAAGRLYLYTITPRPGFLDSITPDEEAVMDEHFEYLRGLQAGGRLMLAGPCEDGAFGIVILRVSAPDEVSGLEQARGMMLADPAVRAGTVRAEMHPFRLSLS